MRAVPTPVSSNYLKTFGMPVIMWRSAESWLLRRKDLALMIYLRLAEAHTHSRSALAALLWGDHTEDRARHSLSQAVGRLRAVFGTAALAVGDDAIRWEGRLDCDAVWLEEAHEGAPLDDALLHFYTGDFLTEFHLANGAESFNEWAGHRRVYYRTL